MDEPYVQKNVQLIRGSFGKEILLIKQRFQSLYKSCTVSHFYGTEFEIWAGFGLVLAILLLWAVFMGIFKKINILAFLLKS